MNRKNILEQLKNFKTDETKALWMLERIEGIEKDHEQFKDKLSDATAKTINEIIEEDLTIPDKVMKFASKGELYDDLIKQFKIRMSVEEGMIDEPVKKLLKEAKEEIIKLRANIQKTKTSTAMIKEDIKEMDAQIYAYEKIELLENDNLKKRAKKLTEGTKSKDTIDTILEQIVKEID